MQSKSNFDFSDQVVVVTGAAGNLGRAVAAAFAAAGASLVLIDLQPGALATAHPQPRSRDLLLAADLLDAAAVATAVETAIARFGRIDALCNIAGGFRMGSAVHETSQADWDLMLSLNAGTLLNMVRAVTPHMMQAGAGRIVNVGAIAAQKGAAQMGAYCAGKAAVIRLTESLSAELRERGINVNCVLPSIIDTPENRACMPAADPARWVAPEDLAQVILFLCSAAARAIHGAAIPVANLS